MIFEKNIESVYPEVQVVLKRLCFQFTLIVNKREPQLLSKKLQWNGGSQNGFSCYCTQFLSVGLIFNIFWGHSDKGSCTLVAGRCDCCSAAEIENFLSPCRGATVCYRVNQCSVNQTLESDYPIFPRIWMFRSFQTTFFIIETVGRHFSRIRTWIVTIEGVHVDQWPIV